MKITVISNSSESLVRFRGPLLKLLVKRGHEVHVLAPRFSDGEREELLAMGVHPDVYRVERTGQNPLSDLGTLLDLISWFRRHRPEVSLTYFIKPNIYGGLAAVIARIPRRVAMVEGLGYLYTDIGSETFKRRSVRSIVTLLLRCSIGNAHRVVFLNPDDRDEFIDRKVVRQKKTLLLGGIGVDLSYFAPAPLPDGPPIFLMIARLLREKGVREYAGAARIVRARYPDVRFQLVGGLDSNPGGIPLEEVRQFAANGDVEWLGEMDDVRDAIAECSAFVLPSYREGVPRSTQEAMAMGRAVVTTDVPGCRETVVSEVNGFYVAPRDVRGLADAILRLCGDPALFASMGRESRRLAEARFDVDKVNERMYEALIGAAP